MENIIFVLIGVIWLVYSVVNANKKKNAAPPSSAGSSQDHGNRSFEDIMAEILGTKEVLQNAQDQFVESPEEVEVVEEEMVGNAYQTLEDLYLQESLENEMELRVEEPVKDNLEPRITELKRRKQQFDLRTAIIYQAIMERPHA